MIESILYTKIIWVFLTSLHNFKVVGCPDLITYARPVISYSSRAANRIAPSLIIRVCKCHQNGHIHCFVLIPEQWRDAKHPGSFVGEFNDL